MRKSELLILSLAALWVFSSIPVYAQDAASTASAPVQGSVIFCASLDSSFNAVGQSTEFETNQVSAVFSSGDGASFKVIQTVLSIYKIFEGESQKLVHRETVDINPDWNVLYLQDIPLPEVGKYLFVITSSDGKTLSSGQVTIKAKNVDKEIPKTSDVKGSTLESLFNFYKEKAVPGSQ